MNQWRIKFALCCCLLVTYLITETESQPVIEERTFGLQYPQCDLSRPCLNPATFCGVEMELFSKWLVGNRWRCYPKKTSLGFCNQPVVCMSGVCNIIAFGMGFCM